MASVPTSPLDPLITFLMKMSCLIEAGHDVLIHCFSPLRCTFFDDRLWGLSDLFCYDIGAMANIWYDIDNFDYCRYNTTASWWCAWTSRMMMSSLLMVSTYLIILCWKEKNSVFIGLIHGKVCKLSHSHLNLQLERLSEVLVISQQISPLWKCTY